MCLSVTPVERGFSWKIIMGQAKNRGTREQRVQEALERTEQDRLERERNKIEAAQRQRELEAAMTTEQRSEAALSRSRSIKNRLLLASVMALTGMTP